MHELSIAQNIVEMVQRNLPAGEQSGVKYVRLKVGGLAGIVVDSLDFCFNAIITGTPLEGAQLQIESIPVKITCNQCGQNTRIRETVFSCPQCGSLEIQMTSGSELQVVEIELADQMAEAI